MIDYQAMAAKVSKEQDDPSITAEYLEAVDNRPPQETRPKPNDCFARLELTAVSGQCRFRADQRRTD